MKSMKFLAIVKSKIASAAATGSSSNQVTIVSIFDLVEY